MSAPRRGDAEVAIVTGGGGGIGAAMAVELGRRGAFVVTVDPMVTVDGRASAAGAADGGASTAERIVASGGRARASGISVTDRAAVRSLIDDLIAEHGRVDAVVNVAGITRPTGFATGSDEDWMAVLDVHLNGYVNLLDTALPVMAAAGSGRILGVTSGSGWRPADAGAYSCAKRAVAALTWQLGAAAPPGVSLNAISPIAMTRMVAAALARASRRAEGSPRRSTATGGLSLGGMPEPEALAPLGAHLALVAGTNLQGQVLFAGGSEVALVRPPRLIEVVRTPDPRAVGGVLDAVVDTWAAAEAHQATTGGANPRFGGLYAEAGAGSDPIGGVTPGRRVLVVGDGAVASLTARRLEDRAATTVVGQAPTDEVDAVRALLDRVAHDGALDAVIVAMPGSDATGHGWESIVADHVGLADRIAGDARWSRAVADLSRATERALRLVTVVDAATPGGRSRAQAAAQLARAGEGATDGRVVAFAVAVEDRDELAAASALAAMLAVEDRAAGLAGAELAVGAGWIGLRSHPTPAGSVVYGGPGLPDWLDVALGEMAGREAAS